MKDRNSKEHGGHKASPKEPTSISRTEPLVTIVEEGIQILMDSKNKNIISCVYNTPLRRQLDRPKFNPNYFGYSKSLKKISAKQSNA